MVSYKDTKTAKDMVREIYRSPVKQFEEDQTAPHSLHYVGSGVQVGQADRIVGWFKLRGTLKHRAFYGDLTAKRLGVTGDDIKRLKGHVDHVYHLAAVYDLSADAESVRSIWSEPNARCCTPCTSRCARIAAAMKPCAPNKTTRSGGCACWFRC